MTLFSEPEHNGAGGFDAPERRLLGKIIGGSLSHGLDMRLEPHISLESVKVGQYVTVDGEQTRFFCVVSDLRLEATDAALASSPPDLSNSLVAEVLRGTGTYGVVHLAPTLTYGAVGRSARPHCALTLRPGLRGHPGGDGEDLWRRG